MANLSVFGERLRAWRKRRGLSQLDLALMAGTTPRYVSFVETGRSRPGRGVVLRLAGAMNLSLRDRNDLLVAAGLPPAYAERPLDHELMAPVRAVVEQMLAKHEPYPAFVFAPGLRILMANKAGERMMPGLTNTAPEALVDMWCTRMPGQSEVEHQASVHQVIAVLRNELFHHPHPDLAGLLRRAESHAADAGQAPDTVDQPICATMVVGGRRVRTLATVVRFDKATEVTMAEIRIELVFPADADSAAYFEEQA